jgi:putative transposase
MTAYRRLRLPGATYFFTLCLADRSAGLLLERIDLLRAAWSLTARERAFRTDAVVILPDHLHAIWTLPPGDADFSTRWRLIKTRFTRALCLPPRPGPSQRRRGEHGLWQRRFWEHAIRDEADMALHLRYCWLDPVQHGLVRDPADWPSTSFHRDLRQGRVPARIPPVQDGEFGEPAGSGPAWGRMGEYHPSYVGTVTPYGTAWAAGTGSVSQGPPRPS